MIMRHGTIFSDSGKNTHRNNSNDKYGWICFQLVSSIIIKWQNMFSDEISKSLTCYIVFVEIHNIRHQVDQYVLMTLKELSELLRMTSSTLHESVIYNFKQERFNLCLIRRLLREEGVNWR